MDVHIPNYKKKTTIIIDRLDYLYLRKRGIERSQFLKQAITAFKEGKFDYQFLNEDDDLLSIE